MKFKRNLIIIISIGFLWALYSIIVFFQCFDTARSDILCNQPLFGLAHPPIILGFPVVIVVYSILPLEANPVLTLIVALPLVWLIAAGELYIIALILNYLGKLIRK